MNDTQYQKHDKPTSHHRTKKLADESSSKLLNKEKGSFFAPPVPKHFILIWVIVESGISGIHGFL